MKLRRVKTDKSDAFMIYNYAQEQSLEQWRPEAAYIVKPRSCYPWCKLIQDSPQFKKNKLHALENRGHNKVIMAVSIKRQLRHLKNKHGLLEKDLETLIKSNGPNLFSRLNSIPGIGKKTAVLMMVSTSNFNSFGSYKQVSSYLGLASNERSSGNSIRGRSRISKTGDGLLRNHLFMCSFTASIHNPQCKLYLKGLLLREKVRNWHLSQYVTN